MEVICPITVKRTVFSTLMVSALEWFHCIIKLFFFSSVFQLKNKIIIDKYWNSSSFAAKSYCVLFCLRHGQRSVKLGNCLRIQELWDSCYILYTVLSLFCIWSICPHLLIDKGIQSRQNFKKKSSVEEWILDYMASHIECRINNNALLQCYFLTF